MPGRSRRTTRSDVPTRSTGYQDELARIADEQRTRMGGESEGLSDYDLAMEARWGSWTPPAEQATPETTTPVLDEAAEETAAPATTTPETTAPETTAPAEESADLDQEVEDFWSRWEDSPEHEQEEVEEHDSDRESQATRNEEQDVSQDQQVQPGEEVDPNAKVVSSKAMMRLAKARSAIAHTKSVLNKGAGNQMDALRDTKFNSYFRMKAMRDPECWVLDPGVMSLAQRYPDALVAAKADLAHGGNCGEHAMVAFDYLRMTAGDVVNRVDVKGLDHAFVIIGGLNSSETDADLAVCDPWPTGPTACIWQDHFAHTADRGSINTRNSVSGDDEDVKAAIAAGLSLSRKGEQMVQQYMSEEDTEKQIDKGREGDHPWIWQHSDTTSGGPESYRGPSQS